jgi:ATP-dependent Clp protease ATP-binding subunit ClpA
LLLGLFREDKALVSSYFPVSATVEAIRQEIERHTTMGKKISTSVDLPLSTECKRVLAYGAEEAERMKHHHIATSHLLLGLFREEKCFAAQLLREHGLQLAQMREKVMRSNPASGETRAYRREWPEALAELLRAWEQAGGISVATGATVGNHTPDFAIYAGARSGAVLEEGPMPLASTSEEELTNLRRRLQSIIRRMEDAIAHHEFQKARHYSDEESTVRQRLRQLREQHNLGPADDELNDLIPFLCIEIVRDDRFSDMRRRFDDYLSAGVAQVWALDFSAKRAYTVTAATGLSEFKGETLQIMGPAVELDLKRLFV